MLEIEKGAEISPCGSYRYLLWRRWKPGIAGALFVMLNPSTADANDDDPTIRRCSDFAFRWGFGGIEVANLFALRSTDPTSIFHAPDPVGPENGILPVGDVGVIIAAWGARADHPMVCTRALEVLSDFTTRQLKVACLGVTRGGHPRHPLYLRSDTLPQPYHNCAGLDVLPQLRAASSPR